ncbi:MAG TPA: recombinase zinc beta ribbon domain-containing protein [Candidatus Saccharimonadales bacterium]|nr:recombinase zinc beta ribbon domain-containing protein [Candidatus Saccharimonadales bacterium]
MRSSKSGKPICKSWMHRLLRDPFYTGKFIYGGKLYQGNHPALLTDDEFNLLQDIVEGRTKGKQQKHDFALTGIVTCGECQYAITAEKHIRKYKNGQSQLFAYYRCTKKGRYTGEKCNQAFASTTKIEDTLAADLSQLKLMPEFAELALEALEEIKEQDQSVTKNNYEALQTALNGVNKRITNLVSLKISPDNSDGSMLSDEEFADRKRALVFEKEKITKQLEQQDPNNSEWAEIAKDSFDFGLRASRRFQKGGTDDKKIIFKTVGSKSILLDQKLQFQLRYLFFQYKQGVQKTNEEINRLESNNSLSDQSNLKEYLKSPVWCG